VPGERRHSDPAPRRSRLAVTLRDRIRRDGPIRFDAWMQACLYDPDDGFYTRGVRLGARGAFATAPTLHRAFGDAVCVEAADAYAAISRPRRFRIIEAGGGDGTLAARLSTLGHPLVLVDPAGGMRAAQTRRVPGVVIVSDPATLAASDAFLVANEVLDAVAFRLLVWPDEVFVTLADDGRFVECLKPATIPPPISQPRIGARYAVRDYHAALDGLLTLVRRGRVLVIDYGGTASETHQHRRDPVRTYIASQPGGDALQAPGTQDITADVDFDAVSRVAAGQGFSVVRDASQAAWLSARGVTLPPASVRSDHDWRLARLMDERLSFRVMVLERG
jgi:NADH dehydrogenase [ubiquinone] 1 alpha subcomplex assembly factor 7